MLIPWGTDAPIYHLPIATGGLIVANVVVFCGQVAGAIPFEPYALSLGDGVHPLQWLTGLFLHGSPWHLLGNMLFLWVFGMIVEGKVGWLGFLSLYLGVGVLESATEQFICLGLTEPSVAMGSSGAMFGMMALCLVWAPMNEVTCHVFYSGFLRFGYATWEAPIVLLSLLFVGQEVVWFFVGRMTGLPVFSAFAHLTGAVWGWLAGTILVKCGWADCEEWDMYSLMKKRASLGAQWHRRGSDLERKRKSKPPKARHIAVVDATPEQQAVQATNLVEQLVADGVYDQAARKIDVTARTLPDWPIRSDLLSWIKRIQQDDAAELSVPLMKLFCARFPDQADRVRLRLAQTYLTMRKPNSASRALAQVSTQRLPADLLAVHQQLDRKIRVLAEEGAYEIEGSE
jgi:membrane associated rhomboid family serine protease